IYIYYGGVLQDATQNHGGIYLNVNTSVVLSSGGQFVTQGPSYYFIYYLQISVVIDRLQFGRQSNLTLYGPYSIVVAWNGQVYDNGTLRTLTTSTSSTTLRIST
ncbi:unnamed protein product, partial [Didymodactylos carnosus]